jgi:general secretion pathway protein E/type IV pilus assembly protein PilB
MNQEPEVIKAVNDLLRDAIAAEANDVQLEPQANGLRIRYRIDGVLYPQLQFREFDRFPGKIVSRLKIMARLNPEETGVCRDGRIELHVSGRDVDVRVLVIPGDLGDNVAMRLLYTGENRSITN